MNETDLAESLSDDTQGLPGIASANSEGVEELVEAGQFLEADAILGVEDSKDPDMEEVRTRQLLADDIPQKYLDED